MEEASAAGVRAVFLGYYFKWDPDVTAAVAEANGFERNPEGARTGYYDYADIETMTCYFLSGYWLFYVHILFWNLSRILQTSTAFQEQYSNSQ